MEHGSLKTAFVNQHPEDVKARVRKKGITLTALGELYGLSGATTRMAVHRPQPSGNIAIAHFLGQHVNDIWPEWFNRDGTRKASSNTQKLTRGKTKCHRQKGAAA